MRMQLTKALTFLKHGMGMDNILKKRYPCRPSICPLQRYCVSGTTLLGNILVAQDTYKWRVASLVPRFKNISKRCSITALQGNSPEGGRRKMRIMFGELKVGNLARKYIQRALDENWVSEGANVREFEQRFTDKFGYEYAIATSSG